MAPRSPLMGFNHNMQHLGWLFHVQTEDGGIRHPRITTHLFHRGVILATRKNEYTSSWPDDDVRSLMVTQHKGVLRELRQGIHDAQIRTMLGEPPRNERAPAASWPALQSSQWEWREELNEQPALVDTWGKAALSNVPAKGIPVQRTMALMPAVRTSTRAPNARLVHQLFGERGQLLRALYPNGRLNGLVVQSRAPLNLGDPVMLQIEVGTDVTMEFALECTVAWKGLERRTYGVEFSPEDAMTVRRMVLLMRGERAARRRKGPLMVSGTGEAAVWSADTPVPSSVDVTERGIFIPDKLELAPGDMVPVVLSSTDQVAALPVHLLVEWRSENEGGGAGLRFVPSDPDEEQRISAWVDSVLRS